MNAKNQPDTFIQTELTTKASEELKKTIAKDLGVSDPTDPHTIAHLLEAATSGSFVRE